MPESFKGQGQGRVTLSFLLPIVLSVLPVSADQSPDKATHVPERVAQSAPVTPYVFDGDVRDLPQPREWKLGDPIRTVPLRSYDPMPRSVVPATPAIDPLLAAQHAAAAMRGSTSIGQPTRNFDGQGFTGANPPDTVGDVGPTLYVQMVNSSIFSPTFSFSAQVRIYDKAVPQPHVIATFLVETLSGGSCLGLSDPIVLYDRQADRWLLSEMSLNNSLCVYISQTGNPVSGGWFSYEFPAPDLPDYPKFGVWATDGNGGSGSYIVATNEFPEPAVYAFDRGKMLLGQAATFQRFTVPALPAVVLPIPADPDGANPPPSGAPAILMRHRDTEINGGPQVPGDVLEMWLLDVDWIVPANTTFLAASDLVLAEFNSDFCNLSFACFDQPGAVPPLQSLHWFILRRLQYMNHGGFESLLGNFTVDVDGLDRGGVRWFELRRSGGGAWSLYQQGTYSIDTDNRWLGAIAMDQAGNIALGFNVVSSTTFPGLRYTGRRSFDSAGVMTQAETVVAPGIDSEPSERYGDYAAMNLDPTDDCTFWLTGEYSVVGQWQTRIASFRFENCPCLTPPAAPSVEATVAVDNRIDVSWDDSISAGVVEYLVQRSRTPGGPYTTIASVPDSSMGIGGGSGYLFQDTGVSGGITYRYVVTALEASACPAQPSAESSATATGACLLAPAFDGVQSATSLGSTCAIDLSWSPATAACGGPLTYDLYRSTTLGFTPGPATLLVSGIDVTAVTDANDLSEGIEYFYVVRAVDRATGLDDGNVLYRSATATGISFGTQQFLYEDFEAADVLITDWTVGTGPGSHVCGEWQRTDLAGSIPSGASGFYALSQSAGCPATSTFLESPVLDLTSPEIQTVTLKVQVRWTIVGIEQATIEVWNGSAWQVISPNFSSVDGLQFFDVTGHALGNSQFQVRFNYQNATDDDSYSVDGVDVTANLMLGAACTPSTAVPAVPAGQAATTPLRVDGADASGSLIDISWDAASCPATAYNLLYGSLGDVAQSTLNGGVCDIGAGTFQWSGVPSGDLFFIVVGTDQAGTESSWGDTTFGERNGLDASGECGVSFKNITVSCP